MPAADMTVFPVVIGTHRGPMSFANVEQLEAARDQELIGPNSEWWSTDRSRSGVLCELDAFQRIMRVARLLNLGYVSLAVGGAAWLAYRFYLGAQLLDPPKLIAVGAIGAGLAFAWSLSALIRSGLGIFRRRSLKLLVLVVIGAFASIYGGGALLNCAPRWDEPREVLVTGGDVSVSEGRTRRGRRRGPTYTYSIRVKSWRPGEDELKVEVGGALYSEMRKPGPLTLMTGRGALGLEYVVVPEHRVEGG